MKKDNLKYRLYRNLNKTDYFSLQEKKKQGYRVIGYTNLALIIKPSFKVYKTSQKRAIKEKKRNVHAYIEFKDKIIPLVSAPDKANLREISYNPFKFSYFFYKDTEDFVNKLDNNLLVKEGKIFEIIL